QSSAVYEMTSNGGSDLFVLKLNQTTLSVGEYFNFELKIFPNPTNSIVNIQTDETIEIVSIYSTLGALVQTETRNSFSIEHLSVGVYTVQVKTGKGITTKQLKIEN